MARRRKRLPIGDAPSAEHDLLHAVQADRPVNSQLMGHGCGLRVQVITRMERRHGWRARLPERAWCLMPPPHSLEQTPVLVVTSAHCEVPVRSQSTAQRIASRVSWSCGQSFWCLRIAASAGALPPVPHRATVLHETHGFMIHDSGHAVVQLDLGEGATLLRAGTDGVLFDGALALTLARAACSTAPVEPVGRQAVLWARREVAVAHLLVERARRAALC